ncbi:hypothetical protein AABC73_28200 [Pseudomonas sp. G.S.17]|uniref:hypothetical protein n=1 Tax=Pseudomonas sp. G.S.17 TaxID=3137451 RepID=UPI00311CBDDB
MAGITAQVVAVLYALVGIAQADATSLLGGGMDSREVTADLKGRFRRLVGHWNSLWQRVCAVVFSYLSRLEIRRFRLGCRAKTIFQSAKTEASVPSAFRLARGISRPYSPPADDSAPGLAIRIRAFTMCEHFKTRSLMAWFRNGGCVWETFGSAGFALLPVRQPAHNGHPFCLATVWAAMMKQKRFLLI